ncbi:MAG: hypothetical protein J5601_02520 [Elusimicrobiaceae bacterium]|nr:hypothetical protein [Elusimicrobiaceae bacterium]
MSGTMIAGIILLGVGVLVFIAGVVLASVEGDGYVFIGVIICVIALTLMIGTACEAKVEAKPTETLYPLTVKVETVNREADSVSCVDGTGNVWEFFGCEDWQEGDFASLLMNDKGTPSIYDDEIITARYAGTFEG